MSPLKVVPAIALVVAVSMSVDPATTAPTSHSFPTFFTQGKLAYCKFNTDISGENAFRRGTTDSEYGGLREKFVEVAQDEITFPSK